MQATWSQPVAEVVVFSNDCANLLRCCPTPLARGRHSVGDPTAHTGRATLLDPADAYR